MKMFELLIGFFSALSHGHETRIDRAVSANSDALRKLAEKVGSSGKAPEEIISDTLLAAAQGQPGREVQK